MDKIYKDQLLWANKYLRKYLLNETIARWRRTPETYQRLERIYNWIVNTNREELRINGK